MNDTLLQIQVFYEIATAIGNSPYLAQMLQESLSAYLHKLSCSTGMVLRAQSDEEGMTSFCPVATLPRKARWSATLETSLKHVPVQLDSEGLSAFLQMLPLTSEIGGGKHLYLMRLPDFGLLLLIKAGAPFREPVAKSLARLNGKLAEACRVCLHNEETARINEKLRLEILERKRAEAALKQVLDELEERVVERTRDLLQANRDLEHALANVKTLSGLVPICSVCKKVRDDKGYWKQIESYIASHSEAMFSHGICPDCGKKMYPEFDFWEE